MHNLFHYLAHPFWYLRRSSRIFRFLTYNLRLFIPVRFHTVDHPVYVDLLRNPSLVFRPNLYEAEDILRFTSLVRNHELKTLFDIGANIGLYSFTFLQASPSGRAFSVEPDLINLSLLKKTLSSALHYNRNVQIVPCAISSSEGTAVFFVDPISGATGSIKSTSNPFVKRAYSIEPSSRIVETKTIDSLVSDFNSAPDIIKIDVEGAELDVIKGGESTIRRKLPVIIVEVSDRTRNDVISFLSSFGYSCHSASSSPNLFCLPPTENVLY
jgi:FkbM family methyltransferase